MFNKKHHLFQNIDCEGRRLHRSWSNIEMTLKFSAELRWTRVANSPCGITATQAF